MARGETKARLLEVGRCIFSEKGYNHTGIEAILQAAGVPKGSFYNYFASKEDFGLQVIDSIAECYEAEMARFLGRCFAPPVGAPAGLFAGVVGRSGVEELPQRLPDRQPRAGDGRSERGLPRPTGRDLPAMGRPLRRVRGAGPPRGRPGRRTWTPGPSPNSSQNGWQGALLRAKTSRTTAPLHTFLDMTFGVLASR